MEVSLKTAFSLIEGRLSTEIRDVYKMLNFIFDDEIFTHQIPTAMRKVEEVKPVWFVDGKELIDDIKLSLDTDDFELIMKHIDLHHSQTKVILDKINFRIDFFKPLSEL